MKSKKLISLLGSVCIVLILVALPFMGACAAPAPTEEVKIDILTSRVGGAGYVLSFALMDIINKTHPWLRATGIETNGISENIKTLITEPARRPNTVVFANDSHALHARLGGVPYEKYDTLRVIALFSPSRHFAATVDSNLQSWESLIGKKVTIFPPIGTSGYMQWTDILKYGGGIQPEDIEWVASGLGPGIDSLADGRVDAAWALASPPPVNAPVGPLAKLIATRDAYFVGFPEEWIKAAKGKSQYPIVGARVPAGTYTPTQQELFAQIQYLSWWADIEMDEDTVYEITKTIYENVEMFIDYHAIGQTMTKDNLAQIMVDEEMFHPGAIKFYKEKGVKIGVE